MTLLVAEDKDPVGATEARGAEPLQVSRIHQYIFVLSTGAAGQQAVAAPQHQYLVSHTRVDLLVSACKRGIPY